jgi:tRNA (cmo5U34)-methyltransferase
MQQIFPGEVFANTSDFDEGIRQLLPRYNEMLDVITNCIPSTSRQILELGCGTGELSIKILNRFPKAEIIALDYSPRMLQFAQEKIAHAGYGHRWRGIEADFGEWANKPEKFAIDMKFDACVSSLAIHHLTDEMKQNLFTAVRKSLNNKGCFWNADPVLAESPTLAEIYQAAREEWANQQGKNLAQIRAKVGSSTTYGYSSQDQLASLEYHLRMLNIAGFNVISVPWKYYGLAVFGGYCNE